MGSRAAPWKILVLDPMLGWVDPPMVLCMIFAHGFGCNGFQSMVLDPMSGWVDPPMVLCMLFAHGFGRDGFQSMVLDTMVFRPWYWMLWHV